MIPTRKLLNILSPSSLFRVMVVLATLSTYLRFNNLQRVQRYSSLQQVRNYTANVRYKNIVWYQLYHGGLRIDAKDVDMDKCEYKHCKISFIDNKMQENTSFQSADAVVFQGGRLPYKPPQRTSINQVFIFATIESPIHLNHDKKGSKKFWTNTINWTMTYRRDSDILYNYGEIVPRTKKIGNEKILNFPAIFKNKTKQVAWFVSDCKTESLRELFVKKLQAFIDIDIYGQCGTLETCSRERGDECLKKIAKDYKFYLSFENSLCKDYMTEKVYSWFTRDLITVVRGARDYTSLLPPDTYIDTSQFTTVKGLANFLKTVGEDEELYTNYIKTKSKYTVKSYEEQVQKAYCEICQRLNNLESYSKSYTNIHNWWNAETCLKKISDLN